MEKITVNGRHYLRSSRPVVVVCVDGSQPEYMEEAMVAGAMAPDKVKGVSTMT